MVSFTFVGFFPFLFYQPNRIHVSTIPSYDLWDRNSFSFRYIGIPTTLMVHLLMLSQSFPQPHPHLIPIPNLSPIPHSCIHLFMYSCILYSSIHIPSPNSYPKTLLIAPAFHKHSSYSCTGSLYQVMPLPT